MCETVQQAEGYKRSIHDRSRVQFHDQEDTASWCQGIVGNESVCHCVEVLLGQFLCTDDFNRTLPRSSTLLEVWLVSPSTNILNCQVFLFELAGAICTFGRPVYDLLPDLGRESRARLSARCPTKLTPLLINDVAIQRIYVLINRITVSRNLQWIVM